MGDSEIGSPEFQEHAMRDYVQWVKETPHALVALMGDIFNQPISGGRASDVFLPNGMTPDESEDLAYDIFYPIQDRIKSIVKGNHEDRGDKLMGINSLNTLVKRLELQKYYDPDIVLLRIQVGNIPYKVFSTHGWGGARRTGGHVNKMEELVKVVSDADVYLTGHEHTLFVFRWDRELFGEGKETYPVRQVFIGTGCFNGYTKFQRRIARMMPNIGAARIRFNGTRKDVHVSL